MDDKIGLLCSGLFRTTTPVRAPSLAVTVVLIVSQLYLIDSV